MPLLITETGTSFFWAMLAQVCRATYMVSGCDRPISFPIFFQMSVEQMRAAEILAVFIVSAGFDERKKEIGLAVGVFIDDSLHSGFPSYRNILSGFFTSVGKQPIFEIVFLR